MTIKQSGTPRDTLRVPWHVAPLAAALNGVSSTSLDLSGGPSTLEMTAPAAAGTSHADLYLLGATDPVNSTGEEDIVATAPGPSRAARSTGLRKACRRARTHSSGSAGSTS